MENNKLVFALLAAVLSISLVSFASAGFFDFFTAKATENLVGMNASIGNNVPMIYNVTVNQTTVTPDEQGTASIDVGVYVYDQDFLTDINFSSLDVNVSYSGEGLRNASCVRTDIDLKRTLFNCTVQLWYFDIDGQWNVQTSITDLSGAGATNHSQNISVSYTKSFKMAPQNLTWGVLNAGDTSKQPTNTPVILNNTGNAVIAADNVFVNSTNLLGETESAVAIYADNMTVGITSGTACVSGTNMTHGVAVGVTGAALPRGNLSLNDGSGQQQLYPCIGLLGSELSAQTYSTLGDGVWRVTI